MSRESHSEEIKPSELMDRALKNADGWDKAKTDKEKHKLLIESDELMMDHDLVEEAELLTHVKLLDDEEKRRQEKDKWQKN